MLAETSTTDFSKETTPETFAENVQAARRGGCVAGIARQTLEAETGKPVITAQNAAQLNAVVVDMIEVMIDTEKGEGNGDEYKDTTGGCIMGYGASLLIGTAFFVICTVVGLFVGHIILFGRIALGLLSGVCSSYFLTLHLLIGIAVFAGLLFLQHTSAGFWIIGCLLSAVWAFIFGFLPTYLRKI